MSLIYHIADKTTWEEARKKGNYEGDTLHSQGFIHCSTQEQVLKVANFQFQGQTGKVLLEVDEEQVHPKVKYETVPGAPFPDEFPHIYGPLNTEAVIRTASFEPDEEGGFGFPEFWE